MPSRPGPTTWSRVECANTGKPVAVTLAEEIPPLVDQIRFFAGAARHLEGKSAGEYMADHTSFIRREPIGVCAAVTPWNYPMMMAVWKWAPALAAGNTMVLKPSDTTPASTLLMAEIMSEFLPRRRLQRGRVATATPGGCWWTTPPRPWCRSPAASGPAWRWRRRRPPT